ncbi:MAG: DEAD/DEAH box helicase family protein, partial [Vulcanimicrobiota bacterium]
MPDCLSFCQGQRVLAPSEPQLGLGVVTECSARRITVLFPKADISRTYSTDTSAVLRYTVKVGDSLATADGKEHEVEAVVERKGLLYYQTVEGREISEIQLSVELKHSDPLAGLAVGKPGRPADFVARRQAYSLRALGRAQKHRGVGAARVELLPHQLYVTERVARMWRPRVLLADEVGLGKTIEAGLIGVRLAALGRASSLAVVAPRALVGQWLAEFYRRFARPLTLFDPELEEHPQDLLIPADDLEFLPAGFSRDLLIVDEAHHYYENEELQVIAQRCTAVLFLTATPSLGGENSLISLLHQLDPIRYPSAGSLKEKHEEWAAVADL